MALSHNTAPAGGLPVVAVAAAVGGGVAFLALALVARRRCLAGQQHRATLSHASRGVGLASNVSPLSTSGTRGWQRAEKIPDEFVNVELG